MFHCEERYTIGQQRMNKELQMLVFRDDSDFGGHMGEDEV